MHLEFVKKVVSKLTQTVRVELVESAFQTNHNLCKESHQQTEVLVLENVGQQTLNEEMQESDC